MDAINLFSPSNDPHDWLPPSAATKFTALSQRASDLYAAIPAGAALQDAAKSVFEHQTRIDNLLKRRNDGGFGQDESSASVQDERRKLERATTERIRVQELYEVRGARWNTAKRLEQNVANYVMRGGIPGGCTLEVVEDEPVADLLKKGERLGDAVSRYRHRLRELAADLHRVRSSPWPSAMAKAKAKAMIAMLAERGAPDVDSMIEHGAPLSFPMVSLQSMVHGTEQAAMGFSDTHDSFGLICWMFARELEAKVCAGIDEVADDKAALDQSKRDLAEAEIATSVLMIERSECACIWAAEAQNELIDFRENTSALALLGVRLVTAPRMNPSPGSSRDHSLEVIHAGLRQ